MDLVKRVLIIFFFLLSASVLVQAGRQEVGVFSLESPSDGFRLFSNEVSELKRRNTATTGGSVHEELELYGSLKLKFEYGGRQYEYHFDREDGVFSKGATGRIETEYGPLIKPIHNNYYVYRTESKDATLTFFSHSHFEGVAIDGTDSVHFQLRDGDFSVNDEIHRIFEGSAFELPAKAIMEDLRSAREGNNRRLQVEYWNNCYFGQDKKRTFSVGFVVGSELFKKMKNINGQSGQQNSNNLVNSVVSLSNAIFYPQMDIRIVVGNIVYVDTSTGALSNPGCRNSISTQLNQLQNWRGRVARQGLWHLLDDCFGFSGGTLGIAKLGVLCRNPANVGVSYYTPNDNNYPTWSTVAHELGHNFNARHSFENGQGRTGGIMDYGPLRNKKIDGVDQFNTRLRKREVCAEISRVVRSCPHFAEINAPTPKPTPAPVPGGGGGGGIRECQKFNDLVFFGEADVYIGSYEDWTPETCFQLCENTAGCKSFVTSENRRYCELWSNVKTQSNLESYEGFDTYICPFGNGGGGGGGGGGTEPEKECRTYRNRVIFGKADIYEGSYDNRWTKEECKKGCLKDKNCRAFTFSEPFKYCEMWSYVVKPSMLKRFQNYDTTFCYDAGKAPLEMEARSIDDLLPEFDTSELKAACCQSSENKYLLGINSFITEEYDKEQCENSCILDPECTSFSFSVQQDSETSVLHNICEFWHEVQPGENNLASETGCTDSVQESFRAETSTTTCDRTCIANIVSPPEEKKSDEGVFLAIVGCSVAVAVVAFAAAFRRVRQMRRNKSQTAASPEMNFKAANMASENSNNTFVMGSYVQSNTNGFGYSAGPPPNMRNL